MQPYAPRPIRSHGVRTLNDWRIKLYSIVHGEAPAAWMDFWRDFEHGMMRVLRELPQPARTSQRPGTGFLIAHQGRTASYVVLGWWDRENELPLRIAVRDLAPGADWRAPKPDESVCVWDLEVIGHERNAYVATMLAGGDTDAGRQDAEYLARTLDVERPMQRSSAPHHV